MDRNVLRDTIHLKSDECYMNMAALTYDDERLLGRQR